MGKVKKSVKSEKNKDVYVPMPSYIVNDTALCLFNQFFVAGNPILNITKPKPKEKK
jgi:hypothetical protein